MSYFNQSLYQKGYLLEFYQGSKLESAFSFSLPPQSEDFIYPQRVNETKTFGGSILEDYGNDTVSISLAGTTANNAVRMLYKSPSKKIVTGEREVFLLQETIEKYGEIEKLKNKSIKLYALDTNTENKSNKTWNVRIKDYSLSRTKTSPFAYEYKINLIAYKEYTNKKTNWVLNILNNIQSAIDKVRTAIYWIEDIVNKSLGIYKDTINAIKNTFLVLEECSALLERTSDTILSFTDETLNLGRDMADSVTRVEESLSRTLENLSIDRLIVTPTKEIKASLEKVKEVFEANIEPFFSQETWVEDFNSLINMFDEKKSITSFDNGNNQEISAAITTENIKSIQDNINAAITESRNLNYVDIGIVPGDVETSDKILPIYGFIEVTIKSGDSWEILAERYLNDENLGAVLAAYNNSNNTIDSFAFETGQVVQIPILDEEKINNKNQVYAKEHDNYGTDIMIDKYGDLAFNEQDLATVSKVNNLNQAIMMRLKTALNTRIRNVVYGIRSTTGSVSDAEQYVLSSIQDTILQEPRVKEIKNIEYKGNGNNLFVSVDYLDINREIRAFGGVI